MEFSQEVADKVCQEIADGKSLRRILREDESLPATVTIFKWLAVNAEFAKQYARAREAQADALFDEILEISDDGRNDTYTDDDGFNRANAEAIQRSKLRVDSRKWMAAKLRPKKYGEKLELSGDPDGPLNIQVIERVIVRPKDRDA